MRYRELTLGLMVLITAITAVASPLKDTEWLSHDNHAPPSSPTIIIAEESTEYIIFECSIQGIYRQEIFTSKGIFHKLHFSNPGAVCATDIGAPSLPVIAANIRLPSNASGKVSIIESEWKDFEQMRIYPRQKPLRQSGACYPPLLR